MAEYVPGVGARTSVVAVPRQNGKTTYAEEEHLLLKISKLRTAIMKDEFVFTMAMSQLDKPGARTRAVNAARRLDTILKEYQ